MLWDRLHYLEACRRPTGRPPWVLGTEAAAAEAQAATGKRPAWVQGMAMRSEPTMFAAGNQVNPQAGRDCAKDVYAQAGIENRERTSTAPRSTCPSAGTSRLWLENLGFCAEGDGWKLTQEGATALDGGDIPWNCSGGVLSPTRSGLGDAPLLGGCLQVRGEAGEHQVDGVRPRLWARPTAEVAILRHVGAPAQKKP